MKESTFLSSVARDPTARSLVSWVNRSATGEQLGQTTEIVQLRHHPIHHPTLTRFQIPDCQAIGRVPMEMNWRQC